MKLRRNRLSPTWGIKNSHVGIWDFPRGYILFLKKVQILECARLVLSLSTSG